MKLSSLLALVSLTATAQFPIHIDVFGKPPNWFLEKAGLERDDAGLKVMHQRCSRANEVATALRDASICHHDSECVVYESRGSKTPGGGSFICQPIVAAISTRYSELETSAWMMCGHATIYRYAPCERRAVCRHTQCEVAPRYCGWLGWSCPSAWQATFMYFDEYQYSRSSQTCSGTP